MPIGSVFFFKKIANWKLTGSIADHPFSELANSFQRRPLFLFHPTYYLVLQKEVEIARLIEFYILLIVILFEYSLLLIVGSLSLNNFCSHWYPSLIHILFKDFLLYSLIQWNSLKISCTNLPMEHWKHWIILLTLLQLKIYFQTFVCFISLFDLQTEGE